MHQEFIKFLKSYKPNDTIIEEGKGDHEFYCLLKGTVGIWKGHTTEPDEHIKVGELSEKGAYFGEMSSLLNEMRTATIIAQTDVKVLRFPGEMLPQMIIRQPKLGLKICTSLADRLKGTTKKQQDVAHQRNEIRNDATNQSLHAKEAYQKIFIMITAVQKMLQHPHLKAIVEYMSREKLLQGGRKMKFDEEFMCDIPETLVDPIKKAYPDKVP